MTHDLETLVKMAGEARELERDAEAQGHHGHPMAARRGWLALAAGVAALVTAGVVLSRPSAVNPGSGHASPPRAMVRSTPATPQDPSMVLAVWRDPDTSCECMVWREASFGGRRLSEVGRSELLAAALPFVCGPRGESELLVVGLQGPREQLPPTREAAHALVSCMAGGTAQCGTDGGCVGAGAMSCVPTGVSVVTETLATARSR